MSAAVSHVFRRHRMARTDVGTDVRAPGTRRGRRSTGGPVRSAADAALMAARFPHAVVHTVEAGHRSMYELPEAVRAAFEDPVACSEV
ncbi:hypothetical protein ACIREE_33460 [Streptomyces sp. NPDC102467]|uniref:hypothetical protein n=1 Tax=Streptomyces sp. NPDC102467 TaxID=3366179 RepID=UPI003814FFEF